MESQKVRHDWATELNWWSDGTRCHDLRFWELSFYDVDDVTFPFVLFNLEVQIGATWWIPATRNLRTYSSFICSISRTLDTAKISLWVKLGSQNSAAWNPLLVVLNSFFFFLMHHSLISERNLQHGKNTHSEGFTSSSMWQFLLLKMCLCFLASV